MNYKRYIKWIPVIGVFFCDDNVDRCPIDKENIELLLVLLHGFSIGALIFGIMLSIWIYFEQ